MLPDTIKRFFWDIPLSVVDRVLNKNYIIERILELGDDPAVRWLEGEYSPEDLRSVVQTSRALSPRSRNYWKLRYDIT
jgi:hypothetical protein